MPTCIVFCAFAVSLALGDPGKDANGRRTLDYAPAPVDNPLKGLVPYAGRGDKGFPHVMEFDYVPFSALVKGYEEFDWKPLDTLLDGIAGRGRQAVFRVFLEYPGKRGVIPEFLIRDGLKVEKYVHADSTKQRPLIIETPDYRNKNLQRVLNNFIRALGKKYDGDARIGFITAGLLGTWGEWHTYPREELFADKALQSLVMDAYASAFRITPVLLRYPAGPSDATYASNAERRFGYHDDSFAWATLATGKRGDGWFFMNSLKTAGPSALEKWKTAPIGGEIRPEAWGKVFDAEPVNPKIQNFRRCVEATHVTWLMDTGMFGSQRNDERIRRATVEVQRMGYEFYVPAATVGAVNEGRLPVAVELVNRGVAPFYYDWPAQFGLIKDGRLNTVFPAEGKLTGLLPGDPVRLWKERLDVRGVAPGRYRLALRVSNPLPNGRPVQFANTSQNADITGWLTLGDCLIPPTPSGKLPDKERPPLLGIPSATPGVIFAP